MNLAFLILMDKLIKIFPSDAIKFSEDKDVPKTLLIGQIPIKCSVTVPLC